MGRCDHHKYQDLRRCPCCNKSYNEYWKIVNHIRKTKDEQHQSFLKQQEDQYIEIYDQVERQSLHDELARAKNIFAGTSFAHSSNILTKKYSAEELEQIRRQRIAKKMATIIKTPIHNRRVSEGIKRAWKEGKFDTEEIKEARRKGYAKRPSLKGKNNPMYGKPSPKGSGTGKGGIRKDIGHYVRSCWEANICRVCNHVGREYRYEPTRFSITVDSIERTYCPDLYFPKNDLYYEIKGHARSSKQWLCDCKTCIRNKKILAEVIRKYAIHIIIVGRDEYRRFGRMFRKSIPKWER